MGKKLATATLAGGLFVAAWSGYNSSSKFDAAENIAKSNPSAQRVYNLEKEMSRILQDSPFKDDNLRNSIYFLFSDDAQAGRYRTIAKEYWDLMRNGSTAREAEEYKDRLLDSGILGVIALVSACIGAAGGRYLYKNRESKNHESVRRADIRHFPREIK